MLRNFLVSLKLTVVLLVLSILLVFFATLDQVNLGIWAARQKWFHSFFVRGTLGGVSLPFFPGGCLLGGLLFLNLAAGHIYRFRFSLKKTGLLLAHLGLLMLLAGIFFAGLWQEDYGVTLRQGQTATCAESFQHNIPNVPDASNASNAPVRSPARRDFGFSLTLLEVTHEVHPGSDIPKNFASRVLLRDARDPAGREVVISMNKPLRHNGLTFYQNTMNAAAGSTGLQVVRNPARALPYVACALVFAGLLLHFLANLLARQRPVAQTAKSANDMGAQASRLPSDQQAGRLRSHVPIQNPKSKMLSCSPAKRAPEHDKPFASLQAIASGDAISALSRSVQNSLALLPALLCAIWIATTLIPPSPPNPATNHDTAAFGRLPVLADGRVKPLDTVARSTLLRIQGCQSVRTPDGRNITPAEWLLDTVFHSESAQHYRVFQITHPEVLALARLTPADGDGGKRFSFAQLAPRLDDIDRQSRLVDSPAASRRDTFQRAIHELYGNLIEYQRLQYSFVPPGAPDFLGDLMRHNATLARPAAAGNAGIPPGGRRREAPPNPPNGSERQRHSAHSALPDYPGSLALAATHDAATHMSAHASLLPMPPAATQPAWLKTGDALAAALAARRPIPPAALAYAGLARAWQAGQPAEFNKILQLYHTRLARDLPPRALEKINLETRFNAAQPFFSAIILCALAFVLGAASWAKHKHTALAGRAASLMLLLAWLLMTGGILARAWIEGRLPVTSLYTTALATGWCVVTLSLVLEKINKNGLAIVAGSLAGLCALIIAHNLSLAGDTLKVMPAVLDSNFWLTLHVGTIIAGYAATFVAGLIAALCIIRDRLAPAPGARSAASHERVIYGIICFALFFSFAGTVLGGFWADQTWGRFWGWDPKENGALILVTWHAVVLHARRGKFAGPRAIMAMAVFGNIVVALGWFGTNMLGVGLHSYGFMSGGLLALACFIALNLAIIALAQFRCRKQPP